MDEPEKPNVRQLDARSLRGLAHPLRLQLLRALRLHGPATASMLAERLGESSGATSYHLRQLAAHGFVADAPERGKGRERWWRMVDDGISFDEGLVPDDPATRGAMDVLMHEAVANHTREMTTFVATRHDWLPAWSSQSTDLSDYTLRLTPAEATELIEKMHALINSYRGREAPDATTVRVHTHAFPISTD
ncbi:helix-turn-helix domain-containing protein [Streptomyces sp. enrichment culture]|uniref:helix-turn-helix domain-containing protein n=1 Tax=Streptomyces sp. enrichment culture TaxID=1795815 RepID=UPI003F55F5EE